MDSRPRPMNFPFKRPWMKDNCAAAAAAGNTGLKGIIAGNLNALVKKNISSGKV